MTLHPKSGDICKVDEELSILCETIDTEWTSSAILSGGSMFLILDVNELDELGNKEITILHAGQKFWFTVYPAPNILEVDGVIGRDFVTKQVYDLPFAYLQ